MNTWFLPRLLGKKCMFGVPGQPINIYPPQVHAWCCLKRKLWKENGIRQTGIQDLTILLTHTNVTVQKFGTSPIHPWRLLKRNPTRKRMQQELEESRIYQPKFILRDFGKEALKKEKKNSRNPRSTHPTFLPVLGQVHKTIDRIH